MPEGDLTVVVFHGALSGTTTAELRFLRDCEESNLHCYEYDGEAAFDPGALAWAGQRDPLLVLRIQELGDFPDALSKLAGLCSRGNVTLRLLTTVRTERLKVVEASAPGRVEPVLVPDRLKDEEIREVLSVLSRNHRLNVFAGRMVAAQVGFFSKEHHRSLIDGLAAATLGSGFVERIRDEYRGIVESRDLEIAKLLLLAAELGHGLPEGLAARTLGRSSADIARALDHDNLGSFGLVDQGLLRPRHTSLAARVSREFLVREERYDLSWRLALTLAPYVSRSTISARTRPARLAGQLMDAQRVFGWFGRDLTEQWYESLYAAYSWNSRYWEQRALAECEDPQPRYEMAEAWAREGIAKHRDPFSLNTLGTVLLRRAISTRSLDQELFYMGLDKVAEAREGLRRPSEHPYVTALSYIRRAYRLTSDDGDFRERLAQSFAVWEEYCRESPSWRSPQARKLMLEHIDGFRRATRGKEGAGAV